MRARSILASILLAACSQPSPPTPDMGNDARDAGSDTRPDDSPGVECYPDMDTCGGGGPFLTDNVTCREHPLAPGQFECTECHSDDECPEGTTCGGYTICTGPGIDYDPPDAEFDLGPSVDAANLPAETD